MPVSPQRECRSDESLRFFLNFFMRFAMVLKGFTMEEAGSGSPSRPLSKKTNRAKARQATPLCGAHRKAE